MSKISIPKILSGLFFTYLLLFSTISTAQQIIKVGVGNFPPFFIEKDTQGLFVEVIDEIFKNLPQYKVQYIPMSNNRILHEINYGKSIDIASNIFPSSKVKAHLSEPVFRFRDVAISKKLSQLTINDVADLQEKSIAAYQGATELLGEKFKQMAVENTEYSEHAHPKETTQLMLSGKKDIRVGDINVFWYDLSNKHFNNDASVARNNFTVHYLWPFTYSHMAFKDKSLKDAVNKVIKELKKNGSIEKIYASHEMQK
ncbi:substrate-binding periplasmic protein [Colwellia hornerae]|uniref:Transporter substrate-binding domain-containing protein n=1 Tax=Colwellia hornerae TaxID=89402 RepID=A0A5C6Q2P9_9GAMM|nr:transporter substrate-binding domain-containing protein [Colwellia hornerae]TWX46545.1 transporter substrate-binding domain-containing protein [Colwellia hornerae]TWX54293.1 transporter substrate-binding domain-containing protein [Colwellia hornerae]TWX63070.1 transporter substrate-binding domain-containing protein [Colwellia hornerae]